MATKPRAARAAHLALAPYLGKHPRLSGYVQSNLDLPLLDSKAIYSELV